MDGDRDVDVIAANLYDDTVVWHENDGSMGFAEHAIADDADGVRWVHLVDLDQDFDLDILAALSVADSVVWYENLCEGQVYARDDPQEPFVNNING